MSKLDANQVIKAVYDETNNAIKVSSSGGSGANQSLSNLTSPTAFNQDLLPGSNNTLNIGNSTHKIASMDITTIKNNGVGIIGVNNQNLNDGSAKLSVDWGSRALSYNNGSTTSLDWQNAFFQDGNGTTSLIYGPARQLVDSTSQTSVDWDARILYDSTGAIVSNFSSASAKNPTLQYQISSNFTIGANGTIIYDSPVIDTAPGNYNPATGVWTAPRDCVIIISVSATTSGSGANMYVSFNNGSPINVGNLCSITNASKTMNGTMHLAVLTGNTIQIKTSAGDTFTGGSLPGVNILNITML